jgi:hypothetical protein
MPALRSTNLKETYPDETSARESLPSKALPAKSCCSRLEFSMTGTNKTVLSIGTIQHLLWLREAVLEHAGFKVFSVADELNAQARIYPDGYEVLLLCYSIQDWIKRVGDCARTSEENR